MNAGNILMVIAGGGLFALVVGFFMTGKSSDALKAVTNLFGKKQQEKIDAKIRELQKFDEDTRNDLAEKRNEYMKEILIELDETVKEYGKKNKLSKLDKRISAIDFGSNIEVRDPITKRIEKKPPIPPNLA